MAYFSNGSEGAAFDNQCAKCVLSNKKCPIEYVQMMYNYDAVNNDVATDILDCLVKNDGTCEMFKEYKEMLEE